MIVVVSVLSDGTPLPMVATIAACSVGALVLARATLGARGRRAEAAEEIEAVEELGPAE